MPRTRRQEDTEITDSMDFESKATAEELADVLREELQEAAER